MKNQYRKILIVVLFMGLLASLLWTYDSVNSYPSNATSSGVTLSIIPDYQVESGVDLSVWPKGTLFDQGMAAYFYSAAPIVTVKPIIKLDGMTNGTIQGTFNSQVILQSIDNKSQIYWSHKIKETNPVEFSLPGELDGLSNQVIYEAPYIMLDIPAAYNHAMQIGDELLFQNGTIQAVVTFHIKLMGTINNKTIDRNITHTLPIHLLPTSFTIPKTEEVTNQISFTEETLTTTKASFLDIIRKNPLPFIFDFILLILLFNLIIINEMYKPKADKEHSRFKEWITEGSVEVKNRLSIHIHSLEGLVDLAIDLDKRVIYDPKVNRYYVLEEDIVYIYDLAQTRAILDNKQQLGNLLLDQGLINPEQLEMGLYHQKKVGCRLGESLVALGFIDETTLYSTLASQLALDYFELNPEKISIDLAWFNLLNVQQARALMTIPLGIGSDDTLIVASGEASREGLRDTLEEIFGRKIYLVASRPSAIYEVLDSIEKLMTDRTEDLLTPNSEEKMPSERIDSEEQKQFLNSYYRGTLRLDLLLKAMGLVNSKLLAQVPENDNLLNWLSGKHLIQGDMANLIRGVSISIKSMDWNQRQEHNLPNLLDLLFHANYLTNKSRDWLIKEAKIQSVPVTDLLRKYYVASEDTIANGEFILESLKFLIFN